MHLATRHTAGAADFEFLAGFYEEESDEEGPFRWLGLEGAIGFEPAGVSRFLEIWVHSEFHDLSQVLTVRRGTTFDELVLPGGWTRLSIPVPEGTRQATLEVNKLFPPSYYPGDARSLAVRVRPGWIHSERSRHEHVVRQRANAVVNCREMIEGASVLKSTPPHLGIDMHGVCNVKPPCVYCFWDSSKEQEGENVDAPFTRETLEEFGPFFDNSGKLINCSIGEPFMMRNIDELFDIFGNQGKVLELTTNGQILTDRNIEKLLGRDIELLISLDAGTPETYAKLRNNTFEKILDNLRRLVAAKGETHGLPKIHLVFMPMKVNVHELEDFIKVCADLQVDRMVLRPLNFTDGGDLEWDRADYHFNYREELLPFDELVRVSARAAALCRQYGVQLSDLMDFGGSMEETFGEEFAEAREGVAGESPVRGAELFEEERVDAEAEIPAEPGLIEDSSDPTTLAGPIAESTQEQASTVESGEGESISLGKELLPVCLEPWKTLYILRRGVLPCCHGGEPVAEMSEYKETWNAPILQEIRSELAAGRFHRYCLASPACPIVRKFEHTAELPLGQRMLLKARHLWHDIDREDAGWAARALRPVKWAKIRLQWVLTDGEYRRKHFARLFGRKP